MLNRYRKNYKTISLEEQDLLSKKRVLIVGCGGLGQYIASMLCRIGIGCITIIDPDKFDESNLNRQQYCFTQNIGKYKVTETKKYLNKINPLVEIIAVRSRFNNDNATDLIRNNDIVIDALDSIKDRLFLQNECKVNNVILVSGAIGGWYGQVIVIKPGDDTLSKIFTDVEQTGIEVELGNPSFTPVLIASIEVSETIKILLGKQYLESSIILYIDLLNLDFEKIQI